MNVLKVIEALDIAFEAIDEDERKNSSNENIQENIEINSIYEDVIEFEKSPIEHQQLGIPETTPIIIDEPYYQVPKSCEPYYETPKPAKPVPLYENVDMYFTTGNRLVSVPKEPPTEKPPPLPIDCDEDASLQSNSDNFRRKNSTHRIKNELRLSRTSFLGLTDANNYLEVSIPPPPDMATILRDERKFEKQMYQKSGVYDSSETNDSRDSGVSENHSRQSSELFTSSEELEDCQPTRPPMIDEESRMKCIEDQIREQEVVIIVSDYLTCIIFSIILHRKSSVLKGNSSNLNRKNSKGREIISLFEKI